MKQAMQVFNSALAFLLVELLCWQVCFAQVDPWERVKLIEQGKKVQVKLLSDKTLNGKMEAWSTEGLSVRQGKDKVVPVAKSDLTRVAIVSGLSRGRKALFGSAALGSGVGVIFAWGCPVPGIGCKGKEKVGDSVGGIGMVVGLGLLVWALFPQHKEVIYTAAASAPGDPARR
jgi:hypothetical protein